LYRHFNSKSQIYDRVLDRLAESVNTDELSDEINQLDDIEPILKKIARHIIDSHSSRTELSRLMMISALEESSRARKIFSVLRLPYIIILKDALSRLLKEKKILQVNPAITARCFVGMVMDCAMGINIWNRWQREKFEKSEVMKNNIGIYVRGLKKD